MSHDPLELIKDRLVSTSSIDYTLISPWSKSRGINSIYLGKKYNNDLWYIEKEKDRLLFVLKWAANDDGR